MIKASSMEHLPVQQAPYKNVFLYFDPEDVDDSDDNDSSIDEEIVAEKFNLFQQVGGTVEERKAHSMNKEEETSKKDELQIPGSKPHNKITNLDESESTNE